MGSTPGRPARHAEPDHVAGGQADAQHEPGDGPPTGRPRGRPRKWASEAERKRAYRERLAQDLAEPTRLRDELRSARRELADRDRRLRQLEREVERANEEIRRRLRREAEQEQTQQRLERQVEDFRSRAAHLAEALQEERARTSSTSGGRPPSARGDGPAGPANRAARRALERQKRK